ncbi:MAG TPA: DUF1972 domain-containing protein, partial [Rhodobacteraceae bacterium]|nr:DUF1972 domain-containing protein [Paracoccaceae bacterium]
RVFMNMDGIEWKRRKWSTPAKLWLLLNEIIGANLAVPIADHPEIGRHIARRTLRETVVIPYGSDSVRTVSEEPVRSLGLVPGQYFVSIARIEPENSILEIVKGFLETDTGMDLVMLGRFDPDNGYHRKVRETGRGRVIFPGAIYEDAQVKALRFHARAYLHGHQVGGTNPSLVEALGAGNAVVAHDNPFNRWTAGAGQRYFRTPQDCRDILECLARNDTALERARRAARARHQTKFRWSDVLSRYQELLLGEPQREAAPVQVAAE